MFSAKVSVGANFGHANTLAVSVWVSETVHFSAYHGEGPYASVSMATGTLKYHSAWPNLAPTLTLALPTRWRCQFWISEAAHFSAYYGEGQFAGVSMATATLKYYFIWPNLAPTLTLPLATRWRCQFWISEAAHFSAYYGEAQFAAVSMATATLNLTRAPLNLVRALSSTMPTIWQQ